MSEQLALTELANQLLRHAEPSLLDARLDVLGERLEDQEVASLLRASFEAGEADSLRDLLAEERFAAWIDRTLTSSEEQRLEQELTRLLGGAGTAGVDDPERLVRIPSVPDGYAELQAWAEEYDVVEALRRPARELWPAQRTQDEHLTLMEAALGEYEPHTPAKASDLNPQADLRSLARAHLRRLALSRGALGARTSLWRRREAGHPALRVLCERLRALVIKTSLSELHLQRFVPAHPVQLELPTGVAHARLTAADAREAHEHGSGLAAHPKVAVNLFLSGYEQRAIEGECTHCAGSRCIHVVSVAARLLDACLDVEDRLHGRLCEWVEVPSWKRVLHELTEPERVREARGEHIVFQLRSTPRGVLVGSFLMKAPSDGRASAGKLCTPQQLLRHGACSDLDRPVLEAMVPHARAMNPSFVPADMALLRVLCEHPAIQREGQAATVRVVEGILSVELLEQAGGLLPRVSLHGEPIAPGAEHAASYVVCEPAEQNQLIFAPLTQPLRKLLRALSHFRGVFPEESFPVLAPWLSSLRGAAEVQAPKSLAGHERPTPRRLLLRFTPGADEGLVLALSFRPLPLGAVYPPGRGPALVHGLEDGKPIHARRDLAWEAQEANRVLQALELSQQIRVDAFSYAIETTQDALGVLARAARLGEAVSIEWAERARPWSFAGTAHKADLKVEIFKKGQWFSLQGGLRHGDTLIAVSTLLEAARRGERFVEVEGHSFLELEQALFERLENAQLCLMELSPKDLKLAPAALPYWLQELGDQSRGGDAASNAWLERMASARDRHDTTHAASSSSATALPELGITLRPYQERGVRWMLSQAEWAHGVCLADEMGLGKTLQAGSVLAARADLGPALVVAPTSLLDNWRVELTRCSSRLKPLVYRGSERGGLLAALGPGDVVLVSYETLLRDVRAFDSLHFATQIIDEAQVIKNARTQRAQAVAEVQADFRIALSGTPIENRLGDLWSLLDLLAPGLLGPWQRFRARFATPIERYEDPARAAQLKALVAPFFLRRTKREVETELPLRTEVVCSVELSPPERELYEAAVHEARRALGHRSRHDARRTVQILAELTRLRQLACHPRLVLDVPDTSSAKLERLLAVLDDILPRGHRALLFSQFTRHLGLVREALERRGVPYLYLDGSTPGAARSALVERFQAGETSLFLISLKAGGTGLNLTEADYVIHLDPWWNPAAEDQASDRAHRLGQQRPVTVVKLVTQDTIEEKVLALHAHKRKLAEAVLLGEGPVEQLDQDTLEALLLE
ncbi:MAG: DEAD/DEAH box helicase [Myxococcales bacterium]